MKKKSPIIRLFFGAIVLLAMTGCGPHKPTVAEQREQHRLERARLDSIRVDQKARTVVFCDSMTAVLMPQVEAQLAKFRYEKDERYEDHGHYVHPLLNTSRNTDRCFLQPYVSDDLRITIRSYFFGTSSVHHRYVCLSADSVELRLEGSLHSFTERDSRDRLCQHEITTLRETESRELLAFVDAYRQSRIQVTLEGERMYRYVLGDRDKQALLDTYQLGVLMRDVQELAAMRNQASR